MKRYLLLMCSASLLAFSSVSFAEGVSYSGSDTMPHGFAVFDGNGSSVNVSKWGSQDLDAMYDSLNKIN